MLERALRELHDAKDPRTVSSNRGKIVADGTDLLGLTLKGAAWRVAYRSVKDSTQPIDLTALYPKSDRLVQVPCLTREICLFSNPTKVYDNATGERPGHVIIEFRAKGAGLKFLKPFEKHSLEV